MSDVSAWTSRIAAAVAIVLLLAMLLQLGTNLGSPPPRKRGDWHRKYSWKAERYFRDQPLVIELCYAIEANDLDEIDRLIAAGADVNARGVSNMTPLMWAYPDGKLKRFERLLQFGADPNVAVQSELNTGGVISPGQSVTYLATLGNDIDFFQAAFRHGADPDFRCVGRVFGEEPLLVHLIQWGGRDKRQRIETLIEKGADLDIKSSGGSTPAMVAVGWFGQYDLALELLKSGADMFAYQDNGMQQLTHLLLRKKVVGIGNTLSQRDDFDRLYTWMEERGADFGKAQADLDRWRKWGEFGLEKKASLMREELLRRRAHEDNLPVPQSSIPQSAREDATVGN